MAKAKRTSTIVNRKARHDYEVVDTLEAGVVLTGPEVKSLRLGQASLRDSYVVVNAEGEAYLLNMNISPYKFARQEEYQPQRSRKLLLHRREIERLKGIVQQKNVTLVPLKVYLKGNRFKVEVAVAKGKKQYQKKEDKKRRDLMRQAKREMKEAGY